MGSHENVDGLARYNQAETSRFLVERDDSNRETAETVSSDGSGIADEECHGRESRCAMENTNLP